MTALIQIREVAATGTWDDDTETTIRAVTVLWSGVARIQALNAAAGTRQAGEQSVTTGDYRVSLPRAVVLAKVGHQVRVVSATDGSLVGRMLIITDVRRGSLVWQRDLVCTDDETRPTP